MNTTPSDGNMKLIHTDKVNAEEVHQLRNNVSYLADHVVSVVFRHSLIRRTPSYSTYYNQGEFLRYRI